MLRYKLPLILLVSCSFWSSCEQTPPPAQEVTVVEPVDSEEPAKEWVDLFDGDDLSHWQMYNGGELTGWEAVDNTLVASGAGWDADEDLITKESFDDFELELEWKLEGGNSSGIFYHVQQSADQPIYEAAPEYQVIDDEGWADPLEPNQLTAGNYAMHAPKPGALKPIGEWNHSRILVKHPHVEHWLNGEKVVEYELGDEDWKARKAAGKWAEVPAYGQARSGHIGLQNAGKVTYRNVRIREL